MRLLSTIFFFGFVFSTSLNAQNASVLASDSSAFMFFHANVEPALNPDHAKGRPDFFKLSALDMIYEAFTSVLVDSAELKLYPVEHLMALRGKNPKKMEYPQYDFKFAKKRKSVPLYIHANILFEATGNSSSKTETKISIGKIGGKKTENKQKLRMVTVFKVFSNDGTKLKDFKSVVESENEIVIPHLDGLDIGAAFKVARAKGGEPEVNKDEEAFKAFIKTAAGKIAEQLKN
jgi:hypothetical protein